METRVKEYMVDRTKIGFIRFIFEAHEGVAVVSTIDSKKGHIKISIAPDCMGCVELIIEDLKKDFKFDAV